MTRAFEFPIGQLHANTAPPTARELLALMHSNLGVDQSALAGMNDAQLLRAADACRFLFNNLPPATLNRVESVSPCGTVATKQYQGNRRYDENTLR